jgi:hypothetical protein
MTHLPELTLPQVAALRAIAATKAGPKNSTPLGKRTAIALQEKFCIAVPKGLHPINEALLTPTGRQALEYYDRRDMRRAAKAKAKHAGSEVTSEQLMEPPRGAA